MRSLTREELQAQCEAWGQPSYRAGQVLEWLYGRTAGAWDQFTNLPKDLRRQLAETYTLMPLQLVRKQGADDSTQKFLWRLMDGSMVESVLIPANPALYGDASDR
ncbi:MAG: 23S rRNA (adenine(2503)-C(2))-methyltransferase RlmN, partial [Verrucomicrobiota bacterium]